MSVYAPMLGTIWRLLEAHGHDPADFIEDQLFRPDRPTSIMDRISFEDYDAVLLRAVSVLDSPMLGLQSARYLHPSHLGAVGGAWLASPSLRSALLMAARFTRIYLDEIDLTVEELPDRVTAVYRMNQPPSVVEVFGDALPASLYHLCNANLGRALVPMEVRLARARPADPKPWHDFFKCTVRFEQAENSMSISPGDADEPLTGSMPELVAIHDEIMQAQMARLDRQNIVYRIRLNIMEQLPTGRLNAERLARSLHMSKRTLNRKLRENNESFRSMLAKVRKDLAQRYVSVGDYSITEISFLLGYADTSAFSRAFRSWFGHSPTTERERGTAT